MRPKKRGIPRPARSRDTPPLPPATVPRTYAAVATIAGREEHSPTTIAAHAAESTPDDDWVKRTPAAALILPPPPQFADGGPSTTHPCQDTASPAHPSPRLAIPHLVVDRFPNWTDHFQTIGGALGHAPNARAYGRGVIFSPKTAEEFQIVERCMIEAAAGDSAISWRFHNEDIRSLFGKQRRPHTAAAKTQAHQVDHARPLAEAAPRADVPLPDDTPAATAIPVAHIPVTTATPAVLTPVATATPDAPTPIATATPAAPIPIATTTPAATTPVAIATLVAPIPAATANTDAPIPNATGTTEGAHRRERRRRRKRAPRPPRKEPPWQDLTPANCLDNMIQAFMKILTTGMAAYLHEKGAMPNYTKQYPRVHTQVWRTRAGERPAQTTNHGGNNVPCVPPG